MDNWDGFLIPKTGKKKKEKKPLKRTALKKSTVKLKLKREIARRTSRIKNTGLLAEIRKMPCVACGRQTSEIPNDAAHVSSRGAGGDDSIKNVMALCRKHHCLQHSCGWSEFIRRFVMVQIWMETNGRLDMLERAGLKSSREVES